MVSCDELLNPEMTLERLANSELQKGDTEETDGESSKKKSSVYEIAAVVYGRVDADRFIMYMKEVEAQVKEGPELETDTVRITYFKNKSDALKWENPESYSYIFLDAE